MKRHTFLLTILVFTLCAGLQCKQDNEDPAQEFIRTPANADFVIEELVGERWFKGDTIAGNLKTRFTALYPCDSLRWKFGDDTTICSRSFTNVLFPTGQMLSVRLIAYRKADPRYFPKDDGVDTVVKQFYSWPAELDDYVYKDMPVTGGTKKFWIPQVIHYFPIYGNYKGSRQSNPTKQIYVSVLDTFKFIKALPVWSINEETYRQAKILGNLTYPNFRVSDYAPLDFYNVISPKAIYINQPGGAGAQDGIPTWPGFIGYAWISGPGQISIDYQYQDTLTGVWIKDYFVGTKVW